MACPLRIVLVFFSAIIALFLALKAWGTKEDEEHTVKGEDTLSLHSPHVERSTQKDATQKQKQCPYLNRTVMDKKEEEEGVTTTIGNDEILTSSQGCIVNNDIDNYNNDDDHFQSKCPFTRLMNSFSNFGAMSGSAMKTGMLLFDMATGMYLWKLYCASQGHQDLIMDSGAERSQRIS